LTRLEDMYTAIKKLRGSNLARRGFLFIKCYLLWFVVLFMMFMPLHTSVTLTEAYALPTKRPELERYYVGYHFEEPEPPYTYLYPGVSGNILTVKITIPFTWKTKFGAEWVDLYYETEFDAGSYWIPPRALMSPYEKFSRGFRESSLDEVLETVSAHNITLYLPTELPDGLELTAVYISKSYDMEEYFLSRHNPKRPLFSAYFVYSSVGDKNVCTAELRIGVMEYPAWFVDQYLEETLQDLRRAAENGTQREGERILIVNEWPIKDRGRYEVDSTYRYGLEVWTKHCIYRVSSSILTSDQLIDIVESMKPITVGATAQTSSMVGYASHPLNPKSSNGRENVLNYRSG